MANLSAEVKSLSVSEKLELIDALWVDVESSASISEEDNDELDRRLEVYRSDPSTAVPWEQVKAGRPTIDPAYRLAQARRR